MVFAKFSFSLSQLWRLVFDPSVEWEGAMGLAWWMASLNVYCKTFVDNMFRLLQ